MITIKVHIATSGCLHLIGEVIRSDRQEAIWWLKSHKFTPEIDAGKCSVQWFRSPERELSVAIDGAEIYAEDIKK
jgi:hypothetical protein